LKPILTKYASGGNVKLSKRIIFTVTRELTHYDELAIRFSSVLERLNVKYAIVAGLVAILLDRLFPFR